MLASIDLFSGVGGITLALKGIAYPLLYCDIDPAARRSLEFNMSRGALPKAPISENITALKTVPRADIVVGGFPCVGFSARGKLEGFEHEGSGLFYEILRIVDKSGAKAVFLENVPGVIREIGKIVRELSVKRGFELRWEYVNSYDVGAPHRRVRWFCLAIKKGSKVIETLSDIGRYKSYDWSGAGPRRTCPDDKSRLRSMRRWGLMGNSVVPDAVRLSFLRLVSGGSATTLGNTKIEYKGFTDMRPSTSALKYRSIYVVPAGSKTIHKMAPTVEIPVRDDDLKIVLDPKLRPLPDKRSPTQLHPNITKPVHFKTWATPAHSQVYAQLVMTKRSIHTLATQIRFERKTTNREGVLAPRFAEWLMGYPLGFTDFGGDKC